MSNLDLKVVNDFGTEWKAYNQIDLNPDEALKIFDLYFSIFPWSQIGENSIGFDLGCGSGRWAKIIAPRVKKIHVIEPSEAIEVAILNLNGLKNVEFHKNDVDNIPIENNTMDFGYSLGVLHHIPDTEAALFKCVDKLKSGAPFLLYLYYSFDNKPIIYRYIWKLSDYIRKFIAYLPPKFKILTTNILALLIYYPFARISKLLNKFGINTANIPLSAYADLSFYTMKTDALDRFGTSLEQRFSKKEIYTMMHNAGLENITFSTNIPYWCAVGTKK
jgi:SAM-dependent methyltransferase